MLQMRNLAKIMAKRSPGKRSAPGKDSSTGIDSRVWPAALPGLCSSSKFLQNSIVLLPICAILLAWFLSVGDPTLYFSYSVPPGQLVYVLSKLTGMIALVLIGMQAMLALVKDVARPRMLSNISVRTHIRLGLTTFAFCLLHVGLILSAFSLRQGKFPAVMLLPDFSSGYYRLYISLGVIAFYLLCIGVLAGWKARTKRPGWKAVHMVWPLVVGLAYWHSLSIGSESRTGIVLITLLLIAAGLCAALVLRATAARPPRSWRVQVNEVALRDRIE